MRYNLASAVDVVDIGVLENDCGKCPSSIRSLTAPSRWHRSQVAGDNLSLTLELHPHPKPRSVYALRRAYLGPRRAQLDAKE